MKKLMMLVMCLCVAGAVQAELLVNGDFDAQTINDGGWTGVPTGWAGNGATQNLSAAQLTVEAQSGENVVVLNGGKWVNQQLKDTLGNAITIAPNQTYDVGVWIGRRPGAEGSVAGLLSVGIQRMAGAWELVDSATYDLTALAQDAWTYQTFQLTTGADPVGQGDDLQFVFQNIAATDWHGQIILDSATVVPEPATMVLLGLGSLVAIRRKK